jgi:hypothetical protein
LKQAIRVKQEIVAALAESPLNTGFATLDATRADLKNSDLLVDAIVRAAKEVAAVELHASEIVARLVMIDDVDFKIESNLSDHQRLDEAKAHLILQEAISAVANANFRVETMRNHNALNGVVGDDIPFLLGKLGFVLRDFAPQTQERRFDRVVELAGFPDISAESDARLIDVDQLLKVRQIRECAEFRDWLQRLDNRTEREIAERIRGFKARVAAFVQSNAGKAVRLLTTSAIGMLPQYGTAAGVIAGGLDAFLVDKVFSESGPAAFINKHYRSLFRPSL